MTQPAPAAPRMATTDRFGLVLPERPDRVQIGVINDAFNVLDDKAANLLLTNTFTVDQVVLGNLAFDAAKTLTVGRYATDPSYIAIPKLAVTPGELLAASLRVTGQTTLGAINTGNLTVGGTLEVTGATTLRGATTLDANAQLNLGTGGAYLRAYAGDATYVQISKLTVTPGTTSLAGLTVNGTLGVTGAATINSLTVQGNATVNATLSANFVGVTSRGYVGAWDGGQAFNVGGNILASGLIYQRASTSYRCWDNYDFNFSQTSYGNYLVQRDASGQIQVHRLYLAATPVAGGRPAYVLGTTGDGWMSYYPANAIGPPASVIQHTGTIATNSWPDGVNATLLNYMNADRTGYWAFAYTIKVNNVSDRMNLEARFAGVAQFADVWNPPQNTRWAAGLGGVAFLSSGQQLAIYGNHSYNGGYNNESQTLLCWFVPTADYPGFA